MHVVRTAFKIAKQAKVCRLFRTYKYAIMQIDVRKTTVVISTIWQFD